MAERGRGLAALLFLLLMPFFATAAAAPRIGLVTMEPGEEYWSRFGHNAILVDEGDGREPTLYNYGYFDFDEPGFLLRFLQGDMRYRLVALPYSQDLAYYAQEGRGVTLQWLAIEAQAARGLADFLAWNALPENAVYRYDYFSANCSTKVRDALDDALGGLLQAQLVGRSRGLTYRMESLRLGMPLPWMGLGMHLGLGAYADRPLSRWEESFVPMRLREAVREVRLPDGRPLVIDEQTLLAHRLAPARDEPPQWRARYALLGLALAIGLLWLGRRSPRALAGLAAGLWALCGVTGLGLLALWLLTDHVAAWSNENLLLFNPLCLALLPGALALWRGREPTPGFRRLLLLVLLGAGLALFLRFLPFRVQDNGDWIVLLLPIHAALAWTLRRRG